MKVINKDETTIRIVLPAGRLEIKQNEIADMPEWAFKMLKTIYTHLTPIESVVVEAEPVEAAKPEAKPEPKVVKSVKGKKPRK